MPVTLKIKAEDAAVKAQREAAARRVIDYFSPHLPDSRLLCFLDDEDPVTLRGIYGQSNRGIYGPIQDGTPLAEWPGYVADCIYVDDNASLIFPRVIDDLVYLYGSTCAEEVGLSMTMAHELQHAIQHSKVRNLWAVNGLILNLERDTIKRLDLKWSDIPTEVEARIVSKRAAECLFDQKLVMQYVERKIADRITEEDVADWQFIRGLTPSSSVDFVRGTHLLFERLKDYRPQVEDALKEKSGNPDFNNIDLEAFFSTPGMAK